MPPEETENREVTTSRNRAFDVHPKLQNLIRLVSALAEAGKRTLTRPRTDPETDKSIVSALLTILIVVTVMLVIDEIQQVKRDFLPHFGLFFTGVGLVGTLGARTLKDEYHESAYYAGLAIGVIGLAISACGFS